MEVMQKQWTQFMGEIQKSQQVVSQLSKLYIILHENVRKTILHSTIDLTYDPSSDAQIHQTKILNLLVRLNNPQDLYLRDVDQSIISKFQQQLIDLSEQVHKLLQTHRFAKNNDPKQLEPIQHVINRDKFGLKHELKQSQKRILRSKSGRRAQQNIQQEGFLQQSRRRLQSIKKDFKIKKAKLQKQMQGHVQKKDNQVIFSNKYSGDNLDYYFKLRKELLELALTEQQSQAVTVGGMEDKIQKEISQRQIVEDKLFPQFKIKTKFMKAKVKENILNALAEVKLKLLQQFHNSNRKQLSDGNPDTLIALVHSKMAAKSQIQNLHRQAQSADQLYTPNKKRQRAVVSKPKGSTNYPMAMKTARPLVYQTGWSLALQQGFRQHMESKLNVCRVPNSSRK